MKCPNCGSENADTGRFCYNCGTSLTPAAASERPAADVPPEGPADRTVMMEIKPGMFGGPNPSTPSSPLNLSKQPDEEATRMGTPPPGVGTPGPEPRGQASAGVTGPMPAPATGLGGSPEEVIAAATPGGASAGMASGASAGVAAEPRTPALVWVSLIFGVLAFLTVCNWFFIPSIVALVTGVMARGRIKNSGGLLKGSGLATTGIILGVIGAIFFLLLVVGSFIFSAGFRTAP